MPPFPAENTELPAKPPAQLRHRQPPAKNPPADDLPLRHLRPAPFLFPRQIMSENWQNMRSPGRLNSSTLAPMKFTSGLGEAQVADQRGRQSLTAWRRRIRHGHGHLKFSRRLPAASPAIPDRSVLSRSLPAKSQNLPRKSQGLPAFSRRVPAKSRSLPRNSCGIPALSQTVPPKSQAVPRIPRAFPRNPASFPRNPRPFPPIPRAFPRIPGALPEVPKPLPLSSLDDFYPLQSTKHTTQG